MKYGKFKPYTCKCGDVINHTDHTMKWIYKRHSGVRGELFLVVDGFRYKQCDGTIQEVDLAEDLVVNGETYG